MGSLSLAGAGASAAGNADAGELDFPASYPPVMAVAGTGPTDRKADFSNYAAQVDIAAPSVGILSTPSRSSLEFSS